MKDFGNLKSQDINFHFNKEFETLKSQYLKMTEIVFVHLLYETHDFILFYIRYVFAIIMNK